MKHRVIILENEILSDHFYTLRKITFEYHLPNGEKQVQTREAFDRGNGAAILLYHPQNMTVILTRQFRMPTFINGNPDGMMVEVCAGMLDEDNPEACARRESVEETGYQVDKMEKVLEAYMSPGAVTEILHFFIGTYSEKQKIEEGGGLKDEHENIEVLEIPLERAMKMIQTGEIKDAKTILLLQHLRLKMVTN
ncbi:GDP-mannose pyrophosphatase NudK [Pleomorphovibrio marinus]|uniref:GDP-mannose pyrophosphatase NudK n=1 Tax=Pleomorphovibrio marinus TaxID=2164132 RepID=UPI000E0B6678|nr:GDP-mannose pyrophosphatase NudK [Pleomorphovibrio marinus]